MNCYQHNILLFNNETRHLTRVERSLYRDLIELYYDSENPLICDETKLARKIIVSTESDAAALKFVLNEFFTLSDDGYFNRKCDIEIKKYRLSLTGESLAMNFDESISEKRPAPCPHDKIISMYHDILGSLPAVKIWTDARKKLLRSRWKENEKHQTLDFWESYFRHVSNSDFLMGRVSRRDEKPFQANLEWIIKPSNFVKIIERNYHS